MPLSHSLPLMLGLASGLAAATDGEQRWAKTADDNSVFKAYRSTQFQQVTQRDNYVPSSELKDIPSCWNQQTDVNWQTMKDDISGCVMSMKNISYTVWEGEQAAVS